MQKKIEKCTKFKSISQKVNVQFSEKYNLWLNYFLDIIKEIISQKWINKNTKMNKKFCRIKMNSPHFLIFFQRIYLFGGICNVVTNVVISDFNELNQIDCSSGI